MTVPVGAPGYAHLAQSAETTEWVWKGGVSVGTVVVGRVARGMEHCSDIPTVAGKDGPPAEEVVTRLMGEHSFRWDFLLL